MKISIEKAAKIAGAACAAAGVVALSGLVASGAAAGAVVKGFEAGGLICVGLGAVSCQVLKRASLV